MKGGQHLPSIWEKSEVVWSYKAKKKKQTTLIAFLGIPICCIRFLFPKEFTTIFGLG
jgi:hypothetical protein